MAAWSSSLYAAPSRRLPLSIAEGVAAFVVLSGSLGCSRVPEVALPDASDATTSADSGCLHPTTPDGGTSNADAWPTMPGMDPQCDRLICYVYGPCKYLPNSGQPGAGDCVRTPESCRASRACVEHGTCDLRDGNCVAVPAPGQACKDTFACRAIGKCHAGPGGVCRAESDDDCAKSEGCRFAGVCRMDPGSGSCAVGDATDCRRSWGCRWSGVCSWLHTYACGATSTDDCEASVLCAAAGQCEPSGDEDACARAGAAAAKPCADTAACTAFGLCYTTTTGHCIPQSHEHCKKSAGCAVAGQCWAAWFQDRCVTLAELNPEVPP